MTPVLAGTLAGLLHVVSGPDHLVAVAPLAVHRPSLGARVGLFWGLGHATAVVVLGVVGVVARTLVPVRQLSAWSEVLVGGALIGIGGWALWQSRKTLGHRHVHDHSAMGGAQTAYVHGHVHPAHEPPTYAAPGHHQRGAYAIGMLHGAAGTGHLLGVIPALALRPAQGVAYLLAYGIAAVGAMTSFGAFVGLVGHRIEPRSLTILMRVCGGLAVALGAYWIATGWP